MNEKIGKALTEANVLKFGDFTLVSGIKTPIYVDMRVLPSYPGPFKIITDELSKIIKKLKPNVVAGAETAGIPLATAVSLKTKIPMIYVRKRPKSYGAKEMIEGVLKKEDKVVLIDDMATNGFSKIKFIDGIKQSGGIVNDVLIVLDREQGASETLAKENVKLHYPITLKELLEYMKEHNEVDETKYKEVIDYLSKNRET
jgi:orotate phosphoribosyltransferase